MSDQELSAERLECLCCKATRWEHSEEQWAYCQSKILEDALRDAERIKRELPQLIQPERTCFYMVALREHTAAITAKLEREQEAFREYSLRASDEYTKVVRERYEAQQEVERLTTALFNVRERAAIRLNASEQRAINCEASVRELATTGNAFVQALKKQSLAIPACLSDEWNKFNNALALYGPKEGA